jgi:hypothetical protein
VDVIVVFASLLNAVKEDNVTECTLYSNW